MQIQLQHDSVEVTKVKEGGSLIPPMAEYKGGLYLKHIIVRREIEFLVDIHAIGKKTKYNLFQVSKEQKIITFHFVPAIRLIGKSKNSKNVKNVGDVIYISNSNLMLSNNKTLISWTLPPGSGNFGYKGDKIEVFANVYIADQSAKTLREK